MKKSKFTESQIFNILKQAETGISVVDICREHDIGNATFYKWLAGKIDGDTKSFCISIIIKPELRIIIAPLQRQ